jgi:hypothetical protein
MAPPVPAAVPLLPPVVVPVAPVPPAPPPGGFSSLEPQAAKTNRRPIPARDLLVMVLNLNGALTIMMPENFQVRAILTVEV